MTEMRTGPIGHDELALATRNHGMPLEALRYPLTPAGLHYLLIHYDIPPVDPGAWRLEIDGNVAQPLTLDIEELAARPRMTVTATLECAGNGRALQSPRPLSQPWLLEAVGNAEWTGTPLRPLLDEAGMLDGSVEVLFSGLDRGIEGGLDQPYERSLPVADAVGDAVLLADEMNGQPLLPQHGFPLRVIVPGWYGMAHVKWLHRIQVLTEPFEGYQNARSYRLAGSEDDPGEPLSKIRPRSLMVPPGVPGFPVRTRHVAPGPTLVLGRAWSGLGAVERVEFSSDGGAGWADAELTPAPSAFAWCGWTFTWEAEPGEHELCCRAIDEAGNTQPLEAGWNVGGYANNAVQRVPVVVAG
jgi:DMSO/TMAO reductase YedYZ molybdopterin-dependent catalytic subunit